MKRRLLILVSVLFGFGALAGGAYLYFSPSGPWLEIAETDVELAGCTAGEKYDVVYRLDNLSGRPMRVLGIAGSCGSNACFLATNKDMPGSLPPGVNEIRFPLSVNGAGDFRTQMCLWVDDHGTREIVLSVHGTAKSAPDKTETKGAKEP